MGKNVSNGNWPPYGPNCISGTVRVNRLCLLEDGPCIALHLMRKKKHSEIFFKRTFGKQPWLKLESACTQHRLCVHMVVWTESSLVPRPSPETPGPECSSQIQNFLPKGHFAKREIFLYPSGSVGEPACASAPSGALSSLVSQTDEEGGGHKAKNSVAEPGIPGEDTFPQLEGGVWFPTLHSPSLTPRRRNAIVGVGRTLPKEPTQFSFTTLSPADQGHLFSPSVNISTKMTFSA